MLRGKFEGFLPYLREKIAPARHQHRVRWDTTTLGRPHEALLALPYHPCLCLGREEGYCVGKEGSQAVTPTVHVPTVVVVVVDAPTATAGDSERFQLLMAVA